MRVALFGGTRGVGRQVLERAGEHGYGVKALARVPEAIPELPGVEVVSGNVLDPGAVFRTVNGCDAVIVSLGNTKGNPSYVVSSGTEIIVQVMRKLDVRRILVVSSLGVGDSRNMVPPLFRLLMKTLLKRTMADKERQEAILRDSGLEWTIVRPGGLVDGEPSGTARTGVDSSVKAGRVSRSDVAEFLLDELTDRAYVGATPYIT